MYAIIKMERVKQITLDSWAKLLIIAIFVGEFVVMALTISGNGSVRSVSLCTVVMIADVLSIAYTVISMQKHRLWGSLQQWTWFMRILFSSLVVLRLILMILMQVYANSQS